MPFLAKFVAITIGLLTEDGIDNYMPTIISEEGREAIAIDAIPPEVRHTTALKDMIKRHRWTESSYYFAVRSGSDEVMAGRCISSVCEFIAISATKDGFEASQADEPFWWRTES